MQITHCGSVTEKCELKRYQKMANKLSKPCQKRYVYVACMDHKIDKSKHYQGSSAKSK